MHEESLKEILELNRNLRKKVYRLKNVIETSIQLNSVLNERQIVHSYIINVFGLLKAQSVLILTAKSPYDNTFTPLYYRGISKNNAEKLIIRKSDPIFKLMQLNQNYIDIIKQDNLVQKSLYLKTLSTINCQLATPLVYRNFRFGLVIVGNKQIEKPYSNNEIDSFKLLTNFLAVALHNARVYQEMEKVSLTDPLTGLYNRRYFDNYLQTEISRARRFSHPISLVMLDVDNFKNYNDKLGHLNGDHLLKNIATLLTGSVRQSDIVTRYGGEEFCIILPEISENGAHRFSERLRDTVFSHPFKKREIQPNGHISISLGTATYPTDAQISTELVEKADRAMYDAKKNGKNRVAVYGDLVSY